jgi:kynureninase
MRLIDIITPEELEAVALGPKDITAKKVLGQDFKPWIDLARRLAKKMAPIVGEDESRLVASIGATLSSLDTAIIRKYAEKEETANAAK